jgi:hypothetical protein
MKNAEPLGLTFLPASIARDRLKLGTPASQKRRVSSQKSPVASQPHPPWLVRAFQGDGAW